uniref:Amino acid transporter n=1 Tax=Ditylenchus dipsaci TaxID=166011 RepID=A0A915D2Y3_9BILA
MERRRRQGSTRRAMRASLGFCGTHLLLSLTITSVFVGLLAGFTLRTLALDSVTVRLINFPGEIFMQVLKLMILPLIFSSLIAALAQMDVRESGGIFMVLAIHPGDPSIKHDLQYNPVEHAPVSPLDTFLDVVRNMFPENVVQATFQRVQTKNSPKKQPVQVKSESSGSGYISQQWVKRKTENVKGMNILGIIVFCTEAVIMKLVETLMWLAPIGIVSLIAGNLLELDDLSDTAAVLLVYVITVLSGLAIHTIFTMPLLYFFLTRKNPVIVMRGMAQALVTAFGTASGGAALPVSMRCMEENLKVDRRITRFVLPLGSTINMDGNALYEAVAVIFIAQLNNVTLSIAEVITISFIATIASLGLNSVPADVSLIITADWLLDRIRTSINVLGDAYTTSTIAYYMEKKLIQSDQYNEFHGEIKEEIDNLELASRKGSNTTNDPLNSGSISDTNPHQSFPWKRDRRSTSIDDTVLSWKEQAILDRLYAQVPLNRVQNV